MFGGLDRELNGAGKKSLLDPEESYRFSEMAGLNNQGRKLVETLNHFWQLPDHWLQLLQPRMDGGGLFECQVGRGCAPLSRELAGQRISAGIEIGLCTADFGGISLIRAALEAGREAHFHLGVDAAGKRGIGMKIVDAAAHLEEVQRVVHEFLGHKPRGKRSVVKG